jgi:hypothetical protein
MQVLGILQKDGTKDVVLKLAPVEIELSGFTRRRNVYLLLVSSSQLPMDFTIPNNGLLRF